MEIHENQNRGHTIDSPAKTSFLIILMGLLRRHKCHRSSRNWTLQALLVNDWRKFWIWDEDGHVFQHKRRTVFPLTIIIILIGRQNKPDRCLMMWSFASPLTFSFNYHINAKAAHICENMQSRAMGWFLLHAIKTSRQAAAHTATRCDHHYEFVECDKNLVLSLRLAAGFTTPSLKAEQNCRTNNFVHHCFNNIVLKQWKSRLLEKSMFSIVNMVVFLVLTYERLKYASTMRLKWQNIITDKFVHYLRHKIVQLVEHRNGPVHYQPWGSCVLQHVHTTHE